MRRWPCLTLGTTPDVSPLLNSNLSSPSSRWTSGASHLKLGWLTPVRRRADEDSALLPLVLLHLRCGAGFGYGAPREGEEDAGASTCMRLSLRAELPAQERSGYARDQPRARR